MKRAVLISINPKWCELIASDKKTIEVRKTNPKLLPPFKCYIYETKGEIERPRGDEDGYIYQEGRGAVIGEFVCDSLFPLSFYASDASFFDTEPPLPVPGTCLTDKEIAEYLGNGKTGYGWHITDLKLYAEPKEINEFKRWNRTEQTAPCAHVYALYSPCESCTECNLKSAPQSWCYVEEVDE